MSLTLSFYATAREWLRFDGFDPYNTAPRIVDNMSEARYADEIARRDPTCEFNANFAMVTSA